MRPERADSTSLNQASSGYDAEVINGIELRKRLHPPGHRLDGCQSPGQGRKGRIDKEACELRLLGRLRERGDERPDADSREDAKRGAAEEWEDTPVEWHVEGDLHDSDP